MDASRTESQRDSRTPSAPDVSSWLPAPLALQNVTFTKGLTSSASNTLKLTLIDNSGGQTVLHQVLKPLSVP